MIKRNLLKGAAVFLSCCLVFTSAGCGKKSKTVTTESTTKAVTEQETKKNAGSEEQVTIAVKDSEGNTVEVAGIVETKDNGEKVVIIQDRDGNRTEIKADNYEESSSGTITITDETVSNEITEAAKDDKIPKADEVIPTKPSTDIADNGNNSNGGSSSGSGDNNNGNNNSNNSGNSGNSGNNGSSSSDNGSNSVPSEADTKPSTPNTPSHEHNWEPVYDYIPHEAVKEKVWVVDKAAWEEPVYKYFEVCNNCKPDSPNPCSRCRALGISKYEYDNADELDEHQYECTENGGGCMFSSTITKIVDYVHHDEEGHYETVTVSEAYNEQKLVGYKCSSCGETK